MAFPPEFAGPLLDPDAMWDFVAELPFVGLARQAQACTHTTIAPTVVHGGVKTNVIPDRVELELDIRTLPGQTADDVAALLADALGDLAGDVEIIGLTDDESTSSPMDTPLWDALSRVTSVLHPGSGLIPFLTVGATDARFFRRQGITSYGFGLFSERLSFEDFSTMFHGDDERVDVDSLRLSTEMWGALAHDFLVG
jgi:acetylornithine deacetylase/succinyl-diaminopimelate desuccinylase-like protein